MRRRAPQPLQDIEERVELLKTTLGLFPPDEPEPIAQELCDLGQDILVHWLLARGAPLSEDLPLSGLAEEAARRDGALAAVRDICGEMLRLKELIAATPDDSATGERLVALATAAGELLALTG